MTGSRSRSDVLDELDAAARTRVRVLGLAAALVVAILIGFAGDLLHRPLWDTFHRVAPAPIPSDRIEVVTVDGPSLAAVGGWPWPRYVMARLTEQIAARGAKAIGFDFLFAETDRQSPADFVKLYPELPAPTAAQISDLPSMDKVFAQVIGRAPVVLVRAGVEAGSYDRLEDAAAGSDTLPPEAQFKGPVPDAIPHYPGAVASLDILDGAALGHGLANGRPDPDGIIRRVPMLGRPGGVLTPSLALELVRVAEGAEVIQLEGDKTALTAIRVGRHRVPVDAGGRIELRLTARPPQNGEPQAAYRKVSAADLLRQGIPANEFKDKIVLVGLTAAATSDVVTTPLETETYGVFVQAQAVDAILRSGALRRPPWAAPFEWAVGVLLVIVSWFAAPRVALSQLAIGAMFEVVAAFGASFAAFSLQNLLIDPIPMLAPGAVNSAIMVALLFREGRRVQTRLRSDLDKERGELAAASEIQAGMLLPRHALARITPRAEVDAVLQPAKTVGGDLYDAFLMDKHRLCFLVGDVTGKGVPASLFMALSKALSRSLLMRPGVELADAVDGINAELSRDNGQAMAVSMLVGVLHLADGRMDLCSAGHENPMVIGADGTVRELVLEGGPPLCVADGFPYPIESHVLAPGETLIVLTDGVTEAQSPSGGLFDRQQTAAALAGRQGAPLPEIVDGLIAAVRRFEAGGEPSDDTTVLALRRVAGAT